MPFDDDGDPIECPKCGSDFVEPYTMHGGPRHGRRTGLYGCLICLHDFRVAEKPERAEENEDG